MEAVQVDNKEFKEQLLSITEQLTEEEQANLLSYALQLTEQRNQEGRCVHPHPYRP